MDKYDPSPVHKTKTHKIIHESKLKIKVNNNVYIKIVQIICLESKVHTVGIWGCASMVNGSTPIQTSNCVADDNPYKIK